MTSEPPVQNSGRALFAGELERGKALFSRYQGDITQRASTTNLGELTRQLRM